MRQETQAISVAGVNVRCRVAGSGRPILLIHGLEGWEREFGFFEKLSCHAEVHMPEMPWFGHSETPKDIRSVDDLAYFFMDYLQQNDLRDITLIGANFGGWVAAEIAVRSTARLASIVLLCPFGIKVGAVTDRDIADLLQMTVEDAALLVYADAERNAVQLTEIDDTAGEAIVNNLRAGARFGWQPFMYNPGLKRWLHRLDVPTQLVWGSHDRVVSTEYGRTFGTLIHRSRFDVVENAGLLPQVEQTERTVELVLAHAFDRTLSANSY